MFSALSGPFGPTLGAPNTAGFPPVITSPAFLVTGTVGTLYPTTTFTATGTAPITWSIASGTLPTGMTFVGGVLSGTPTVVSSGSITFRATNAYGFDDRALTLTVSAAGANIPYVMENVVADGVVGYSYSQDLTITGRWLYDDPSNIPTVSIISGTLPAGLSLNATVTSKPGSTTAKRVVVSGTPTTVGTSSVTVQVANTAGSTQKTISFKTYAYDSSRINPSDLTWAGSFRLQRVTSEDDSITQMGYSGRYAGISLSADGQNLFVTSGPNQKIAEYQIPALVQSSSVASLNTAPIVQPFTYPFGAYTMSDLMNKASAPGPAPYEITGMKVVGSDLLITGFYFYDTGAYQQYQVVKRPSNLSVSTPVISTQIGGAGETRYWVGGIEEIPSAFRSTYSLPSYSIGRFGGSIEGSLSLGPAFAAFNPSLMTDKGSVTATKMAVFPLTDTPTTAQSLAYQFGYKSISYGSPTTINVQNKWYTSGHTVQVGTAWLQSKPVVLSIGYIGIGSPWYDAGTGSHTDANFPAFAMEDTWMEHGNHCAPYAQYVWAYTESELASVLTGAKQPWEALPYDVWPLPTTPYKQQPGEYPWIGGVAHDPVNRKIYVAQPKKDPISAYVQWPIIDVYTYPASLDTGVRYIGNQPGITSAYFSGGAQIPSTIETTVNTQIVSQSVTLAGLQATAYLPALIYVSPAYGSFEISINGGAFSSAEQPVVNGDKLRVRLTTSATYAASGSVSVSFRTSSGGADNYLLSFAYQNQNNDRAPQTFQVGASRAYTQLSTVLPLLRAGDIVELDSGEYGPTASNGTLSSVGNTVEYTLAGETSINFPIISSAGVGTITFEQFVGGSWVNLAVSDATTASTLVRTGATVWTVRSPYAYAAAYAGATKVRMRLSAHTSGSFKVAVGKYYYELSPHTVTRPGTSALPITIRAAAGAVTRPVLHNGSLSDGTPGCNFYSVWFRACNVKLEGLDIRADRAASAVATGAGSAFNPAHKITLTNCVLRDSADGLLGLDSGTGSVTLDRCWVVNCGDANPDNGFYKHGTYYGCSLDAFPDAVFTVRNCVYLNNEGNSIKCRGPASIQDNWIDVPNNPYSYYCIELPGLQGYNTESSHINYADVTGNVLISQSSNLIRGGGDGASTRPNAQVRYYKNTCALSGSFLNMMNIQDAFYSFLFSSNAIIGASGNALSSMRLVNEQSSTTWTNGINIRFENDNLPAGYAVSNNSAWTAAAQLASNTSGGTVSNNTFAAFDATPGGSLVGAGLTPPSTLPTGFELPTGTFRTDFSTRVWTTQPTLYSVLTVPSRSSLTNIGAI